MIISILLFFLSGVFCFYSYELQKESEENLKEAQENNKEARKNIQEAERIFKKFLELKKKDN